MKTTLMLIATLLFTFCFYTLLFAEIGEPVPGAEVYVELEPDDEPIFNNPSENGDFEFSDLPPGTYSVIVKLPPIQILTTYSDEDLNQYPNINLSGFYHKKNHYFLNKNKGLYCIQLKDIKSIDPKSINVASKQIKGKDSKNKSCILKFVVTEKNSKIVFNLTSFTPKDYNNQIKVARAGGPYSQSVSNIEDI